MKLLARVLINHMYVDRCGTPYMFNKNEYALLQTKSNSVQLFKENETSMAVFVFMFMFVSTLQHTIVTCTLYT